MDRSCTQVTPVGGERNKRHRADLVGTVSCRGACSQANWRFFPDPCNATNSEHDNFISALPFVYSELSVCMVQADVTCGNIMPIITTQCQLLRCNRPQYTLLVVPRIQLDTYGRRAFAVVGPTAWNAHGNDLRDSDLSIAIFGRLLKTHLFQQHLVNRVH